MRDTGNRASSSETTSGPSVEVVGRRSDVVAGLVGFDTSAYSVGYVAGWADADAELIRSTAARVLATAHQIAAILDPEDEDTDEADAA
ncbi:hypothetical protein [Frigoribacterium sp. CFBP 13605]|uniref:hypothetical protein n=1 Tax=Frigoribacterium sp. CFBP 13605 TaxID=2774034 RepID=UPI0020175CA8|nr:hypothetical protein [Frigoribacterium sp. CFBP 13605]